jgi:Na+/melibiose symporter-like transporter
MRLCDIGIPIVTSIVALFIIMTFELSEARCHDIRLQVEKRREDRRKEEIRVEEDRRKGERRENA